MISKLFLAIILLFSIAQTSTACDYKEHTITYSPHELDSDICDSIKNTIKWFEEKYELPMLEISIEIQDTVYITMYNSENEPVSQVPVLGMYNALTNLIFMSDINSEYTKSRTVWLQDPENYASGLPITKELWLSVIVHEVTHNILQALWEKENPNLAKTVKFIDGGLHEFVAYIVQISLMDETSRQQVLAQYPTATGFRTPTRMNSILHQIHPHKFGVNSYLSNHFWIDNIIKGKYTNFIVNL